MSLEYLFDHWSEILHLSVDHLEITLTALLLALPIAAGLAAIVYRYQWLTLPVLGTLGAIYTIPSLALLAFLIPALGLGRVPAVLTLATYAQVFLVRNILAGLRGVDPAILEAARGVGMTEWQVFRQVRLPLALPVIIAGIRVTIVIIISIATITAWINAGGLGLLLFNGITRDNPSQILAGAIAITTLAILVDQIMRLIERTTAVARSRRATS